MPAVTSVAASPYTVTWHGALAINHGCHGVISSHARAELAVAAAKRQRDALRPLTGGCRALFYYSIVDARTGEVLTTVH